MKINNIQDIKISDGKTAFISGCSGQDGSHMIDYLLKETNLNVIGGARRLSVNNHQNIEHLENEKRFQLVNFDLTDSHSMYKIVEHIKPDYFINFAAQSFVASSWDFSRQTWQTNSTGVLDCLESIKHNKPSCRFYNAGSSEEMGNVLYEPQDEYHPSMPRSPYGASKCAARMLIKVYRESYGIYAVQGWLYNHEGTRRGHQFITRKITSGVAEIFNSIINNTNIIPLELGNINAQRDWSDAEDMVDAVWRMLNQEIYNKTLKNDNNLISSDDTKWLSTKIKEYVVGSGEKHSVKEFVEKSFNVVGIKGKWYGSGKNEYFWYEKGPKRLPDEQKKLVIINSKFYRPAEVDKLMSNPFKISRDLGWKPKTTFDQLVEKMVINDLQLIKNKTDLKN